MNELYESLLQAAERRKRAGVLTIMETQKAHLDAAKARRTAAEQRHEEKAAKERAESEERSKNLRAAIENQTRETEEKRAAHIARLKEAAAERKLGGLGKPTTEAQAAQHELNRLRAVEHGAMVAQLSGQIAGRDATGGK
jgi:flagellar motility protein MotE (MotC chaperone)